MFLASFHRTLLQQLASTFQPKPSSDQLSARQPSTDQQPRQPLAASHSMWQRTIKPDQLQHVVVDCYSPFSSVFSRCLSVSSALSLAVKLQTAGDLTSRRLVFVSTDFNSSSYTRHIRVIRDQVQVSPTTTTQRLISARRACACLQVADCCLVSQQLRLVGVETEAVFLSSRTNVTSEVLWSYQCTCFAGVFWVQLS